jgi:hypothetical protein
LYESLNGSMEAGEKSVVAKHVGKGVIVNSEKKCIGGCIGKTL